MTFSKGSVVKIYRSKRKTHTDQSFWASSDSLPDTLKMRWVLLAVNQTNSEMHKFYICFQFFLLHMNFRGKQKYVKYS